MSHLLTKWHMVQHSNCAAVYAVFTLFIRPPAGQGSVLHFKEITILQGHLEGGNLQRYKQQDSQSPFKTSIYHRKLLHCEAPTWWITKKMMVMNVLYRLKFFQHKPDDSKWNMKIKVVQSWGRGWQNLQHIERQLFVDDTAIQHWLWESDLGVQWKADEGVVFFADILGNYPEDHEVKITQ